MIYTHLARADKQFADRVAELKQTIRIKRRVASSQSPGWADWAWSWVSSNTSVFYFYVYVYYNIEILLYLASNADNTTAINNNNNAFVTPPASPMANALSPMQSPNSHPFQLDDAARQRFYDAIEYDPTKASSLP